MKKLLPEAAFFAICLRKQNEILSKSNRWGQGFENTTTPTTHHPSDPSFNILGRISNFLKKNYGLRETPSLSWDDAIVTPLLATFKTL